MQKLNIAFFASHGGSNMQAIIDAIKANNINAVPVLVISNNSNSGAIERAKNESIKYYHISRLNFSTDEEFEAYLLQVLKDEKIDIIILAGYMKMVPISIINHFKGRILNIHPALLPKFGGKGMYGMNVHKAVIEAKENISGATVHVVDEIYDNGRILAQMTVPVYETDTAEDLQKRVLAIEHIIYPDTVAKIANGEIVL